jgi:hypothetical protein
MLKIGDWLPEVPVKNRVGLRISKPSICTEIWAGAVLLPASRTNSLVRVSGGIVQKCIE